MKNVKTRIRFIYKKRHREIKIDGCMFKSNIYWHTRTRYIKVYVRVYMGLNRGRFLCNGSITCSRETCLCKERRKWSSPFNLPFCPTRFGDSQVRLTWREGDSSCPPFLKTRYYIRPLVPFFLKNIFFNSVLRSF